MSAINNSPIFQALSATVSSIPLSSGESGTGKVLDKFLIDRDASTSEDFSSASADKVIRDGEDDDYTAFRVPKYFQALLTLFACFSLLLCTLTIIRQTRKLCQKSTCTHKAPIIRVDSDKNKGANPPMGSKNGNTGREEGDVESANVDTNSDRKHFDYYHSPASPTITSATNTSNKENEKDLLKTKRVHFVRRVSGPFSDEVVDFVGQTYKKKCKEVEQTENLGKVQALHGRIRTQQSVRKQNKALAQPQLQPLPTAAE